jgi:FkbM family methyltransferase
MSRDHVLRISPAEIRADLLRTLLVSRLLKSRSGRSRDATTFFIDPTDHIGVRVAARGFYDSYRLRALQMLVDRNGSIFKPGGKRSVCLDIGTNIGNHCIFFSRLFDRVVGFEPVPAFHAVAQANVLLNNRNNIELKSCGLSSADGTAEISIQVGNYGGASLHPSTAHLGGRKVRVKLVRGDHMMSKELKPNDALTFIKIDVEGHEEDALRGLSKTVDAHRPVIWFEAHGRTSAECVLATIGGTSVYRHLYLFGDPIELRGQDFLATLSRLFRGMRMGLNEVSTFPDSQYMNVLASSQKIT